MAIRLKAQKFASLPPWEYTWSPEIARHLENVRKATQPAPGIIERVAVRVLGQAAVTPSMKPGARRLRRLHLV